MSQPEPVDLKDHASSYTADKREAVREVTLTLESAVREMLDDLGTDCELVNDTSATP